MKILIESEGREPVKAEVEDLNGARAALIDYQAYTEAGDLRAVDAETNEPIARLRFEWLGA
jgi:hypothetical protein